MPIANPHYKRFEIKASFDSLSSFYPFYLGQHANRTCRRLHFLGTSLTILLACRLVPGIFLYNQPLYHPSSLLLLPLTGYAFAWLGHFAFEKNRPATFKFPIYSLLSDFLLWWEILTLQRPL